MASRKMLIAASLQLFDILTKLLFASDNVERDIPTLTKLALVQNRDMLAGDVILFRQDLNDIQKEMGISSEKIEELTAEQNAEFEEKVKKALARVAPLSSKAGSIYPNCNNSVKYHHTGHHCYGGKKCLYQSF